MNYKVMQKWLFFLNNLKTCPYTIKSLIFFCLRNEKLKYLWRYSNLCLKIMVYFRSLYFKWRLAKIDLMLIPTSIKGAKNVLISRYFLEFHIQHKSDKTATSRSNVTFSVSMMKKYILFSMAF